MHKPKTKRNIRTKFQEKLAEKWKIVKILRIMLYLQEKTKTDDC